MSVDGKQVALVYKDGEFSAISGVCNHVGGPLGEGSLEGEFVVCPWHHYKFNCRTGQGEPGFDEDRVPSYPLKIEDGQVLIDLTNATPRHKTPHEPHPLLRPIVRKPGPIRVVGISTTIMHAEFPRYSTSDDLLKTALSHAKAEGYETSLISLRELSFRHCEGYYSKSAHACTWPCSITQMDPKDQMERVYEAMVHWADVILVATPIRWGNPSSLYYKMVERLNCVQNQEIIANKHLVRNKVASFIITGGQDNIQGVVGQMMSFFGELGFQFPQFPFIAHSRGWTAEDMENNNKQVRDSKVLHDAARALVERAAEITSVILRGEVGAKPLVRGGRKAHRLDTEQH